jgi:hypothetical protein
MGAVVAQHATALPGFVEPGLRPPTTPNLTHHLRLAIPHIR